VGYHAKKKTQICTVGGLGMDDDLRSRRRERIFIEIIGAEEEGV